MRGRPADFVELLAADDSGSALINGNIVLQGDSRALLALQAILHGIDVDWETELATVIGDTAAHQLGKTLRRGLRWRKRVHSSLWRQMEEYIHEEARLLPSRAEIDGFVEAVSRLQDDTDRLGAKNSKNSEIGHSLSELTRSACEAIKAFIRHYQHYR